MKENRTQIGNFSKALETKEYVFFVDFTKGNEKRKVKMYHKLPCSWDLLSNDIFAANSLIEELEKGKYTFIHEQLEKYKEELIN